MHDKLGDVVHVAQVPGRSRTHTGRLKMRTLKHVGPLRGGKGAGLAMPSSSRRSWERTRRVMRGEERATF